MFAKKWGFQHVTSSPWYPQSNGKVENAVKTIKWLFSKCHETGQSELLALLDWRNTPTEGLGSSPAQRFFGRRCRIQLPMTETLLKPTYDTQADARVLQGKQEKQALYYNWQAHDLQPLRAREVFRMQLPGEKRWTSGMCTGLQGPRSYSIQVGEAEYHQNRRHILKGGELPVTEQPETAVPTQGLAPPGASEDAAHGNSEPTPQPTTTPSVDPQSERPTAESDPPLCCSTRQR